MALKRLPRRLQHGEEATLVEHLGELRSRILISLFAIVPVFVVAFVFRDTLIDVLTRPLPDDKKLITLGVTEPFTTAVKVSLAAAFAVTLPLLLYQLWAFLAPALEERSSGRSRCSPRSPRSCSRAGSRSRTSSCCRGRSSFLTSFGEEFFQVEIRASYYFSFVTVTLLASGLAFQMPIFILALVRLRVLTADRLRRNRRIGIALMLVFAVLLPTVDPVSLVLEAVPLILLFELSIQLAAFMEKRWDIATSVALGGRVRILSADWVLPVEGEPIENGAVAIEDGRHRCGRDGGELGEGERFADSAIIPGFVNAHTHLEYAVYAGFGDGLSFGPWISTHVERKRRLEPADVEAIARLGAAECLRSGITTVGDLAFTGASAHACAELGLRAIVYLEVFGSDAADAMRQFEEKRAYVAPALSERVRVGVSPHAPYTCSREVYAASMALELAGRDSSQREPGRARLAAARRGPWQPLAEMLVEPEGMSGIRSLAGCRSAGRTRCRGPLRQGRRGGDRPARRPRRRRHPLPPLERPARLRDRAARGAARGRPPGRHRHGRRLLRAVARLLRGAAHRDHARAGEVRARRRTVGDRRARARDAWRGQRARPGGETGSLVPGKRADLTIVSLSGSPYLPWEDPAAAVVYGGSPGRITATLVDGQTRYEKGGSECHELIDAARVARGRMLQAGSATAIS